MTINEESREASFTEEALRAIDDVYAFNSKKLISALLFDCPELLYWFDKTAELSFTEGKDYSGWYDSETEEFYISRPSDANSFSFRFTLSLDYASSTFDPDTGMYTYDRFNADTTKTQKVATTPETAASIVAQTDSLSAKDRLEYFRNWICQEVSYNNTAAEDTNTPYGDPWQLISVFDNDDTTNVVCEGYAKAFKFLCDLSNFGTENISCNIVTGVMKSMNSEQSSSSATQGLTTAGIQYAGDGEVVGAGAHMWNLVSVNGTNYLVDVTNCDEGTIGAPDKLFMRANEDPTAYPQTVSVTENGTTFDSSMYAFSKDAAGDNLSKTITYTYDADTLSLYSSNELALAPTEEKATVNMHVWTPGHGTIKVNGSNYGTDFQGTWSEDARVNVEAVPDSGYKFSRWLIKKSEGSPNLVEENPTTLVAGTDVEANATFGLENAYMSITAPLAGQTTAVLPQITLPSGAGYSIDTSGDGGVWWTDSSDQAYNPIWGYSATFEEGKTYYAHVRLRDGLDSFAAKAGGSSFDTVLNVEGGAKQWQESRAISEDLVDGSTSNYSTIDAVIAVVAVGAEEEHHVHDWAEPVYNWSVDNKTVTAKRECTGDVTHTEAETVSTTSKLVKASFNAAGKMTYTATFSNTAFTTQTKDVTIPQLTVGEPISKTYNGKAQTQSLTVKSGDAILKEGVDYTVAYNNNIKVGTATITITGKGDYTGSISKTFKIVAAVPTTVKITKVTATNATYAGAASLPKPVLTVTDASGKTVPASGYTATWEYSTGYGKQPATSGKFVGSAKVTVKGKDNYTGTASATFKVTTVADTKTVGAALNEKTVTTIEKLKSGTNAVAQANSKTMETIAKPRAKTMTVNWKAVSGATNYLVGYKRSTDKDWSYVVTGGKTTYTFGSMVVGNLMEFRVAVYDGKKFARGEWTQINCRFYREMVSLKATPGKGRIDVKWGKVAGATGYQILFGTKKDLSDAKIITVKGGSTLKTTITTVTGTPKGTKLKAGKTYYLKVRPIKEAKNANGKQNTYIGIQSLARTCKIK